MDVLADVVVSPLSNMVESILMKAVLQNLEIMLAQWANKFIDN